MNTAIRTFSICITFLLALSIAHAVGIMPAKSLIQGEGTRSFTIVNTEHLDMVADITLEGDASRYLTLEDTRLEFNATTGRQTLMYRYRPVTETLHGYIVVTQTPIGQSGQIVPRIAVKHRVTLQPPGTFDPALPSSATVAEPGSERTTPSPATQANSQRASRGLTGMFGGTPRPAPEPVDHADIAGAIFINSMVAMACVICIRRYRA